MVPCISGGVASLEAFGLGLEGLVRNVSGGSRKNNHYLLQATDHRLVSSFNGSSMSSGKVILKPEGVY